MLKQKYQHFLSFALYTGDLYDKSSFENWREYPFERGLPLRTVLVYTMMLPSGEGSFHFPLLIEFRDTAAAFSFLSCLLLCITGFINHSMTVKKKKYCAIFTEFFLERSS